MRTLLRALGLALPLMLAGLATAGELEELRKKAESGDPEAQFNLGAMHTNADGVPKDDAEAVKWYRKAAQQGDVRAQFNLGVSYADGRGVLKDDAEAVKWFRKAAEQGDPRAQFNLGISYADGLGVAKDQREAAKWYRMAADQGLPEAMSTLGTAYRFGDGVSKDDAEAVKWYRKAAEQGNVEAQFNLGVMHANGLGVPKDQAEAAKWYRKAAEQGNAMAQHNLGVRYSFGDGVAKDYTEALRWYHRAAAQGVAKSQHNLGVMYANGDGVPKDDVEAYKWFNLSAAAGDSKSVNERLVAERRMTNAQVAEAQRLSREFQAKMEQTPDARALIGDEQAGTFNRAKSTGSGFFVTPDGHIVTSAHIIAEGGKISVVAQDGTLPATVVRLDTGNDLAVLKISGHFTALPVISSRTVKMGESVSTVGFPNPGLQGFSPKFSTGDISSLTGPQDDPRFFQISIPVQPGNSGGAMVDGRGNVVGVIAAKLGVKVALATSGALPENVNYAVKSSFLMALLESLPAVSARLAQPSTKNRPQEEIAKLLQAATVLVVVE